MIDVRSTRWFAAILCSLISVVSFAQTTNNGNSGRTCGTMQHLEELEQTHPKHFRNIQSVKDQVFQMVQNNPSMRQQQAVITIPVVVHVVYRTAGENISDAQIMSQLAVLNEDYRATNSDASNTPAEFSGLVADSQIEFCLANRDENDNAHSGITRTSTSTTSFNTNDNVKYTSQGGQDAWDRNKYLNIWVCNMGGGTLGYAQFPGGGAATDGVVISYQYFGSKNHDDGSFNLGGTYDLGRTATHEVGHWLGLYHIWGDDGGGCTGSDNVADTPNQGNSSGGCPSYPQNSCGSNDMTMNYMDYSNDACMYMFSTGQANVMSGVLGGSRSALASSQACAPFATLDASVTAVVTPNGNVCSTTFDPIVTIQNNGGATLSTLVITYDVDGGASQTFNWSGSLATGASENVTLSSMTTTGGSHTFNVASSLPNNGTDEVTSNDAANSSFSIVTGTPYPVTEDFESGTFVPAGWSATNADGNATWVEKSVTGSGGAATNVAFMDNYNYNAAGQIDEMITTVYDLSGATAAAMTFDLAYARYNDQYSDRFKIAISEDCGVSYTEVYNKSGKDADGNTLSTVGDQAGGLWAPAAGGDWRNETVDLAAYNNKLIVVKFISETGYGNSLHIDNINLFNNSSCALAATATATNATCNGDSNGSINLTATGSTGGTTYAWDNGAGTGEDPSGLAAGTYNVTVTDNSGCTATASATVAEPTAVTASATASNVVCNGQSNGSINLTSGGGTGSHTFAWDNGAGTSEDPSGLGPNTYTVVVTDGAGCSAQTSAVVTEPSALSASIAVNNVSCNGGSNGALDLTAGGGTGSLSYLWSNGLTVQDPTGLPAGNYSVDVTDGNGCVVSQSAVITEPTAVTGVATATDVTCAGGTNGSIDLVPAGGTGSITFAWDNGAGTSEDPSGLSAGTYTVVMTDAAGCSGTTSATVADGATVTVSTNCSDISAACANDGSSTATAGGGDGNFTYAWSNGGSGATISSLGAGSYHVTATDGNGCSAVSSACTVVDGGCNMSINLTATHVSCNGGNDGAVTLSLTGASSYTYLWSDGSTGSSLTGVPAGMYSVTATGDGCCVITGSVDVGEPAAMDVQLSASNISCNSANDGSIGTTVTGGTAPYTYLWSDGSVADNVAGLAAGSYSVSVNDNNGCSVQATGVITEPTAVVVSTSCVDASAPGGADGTTSANASGGTPPYTYLWNNGETSVGLAGLLPGTYSVEVTDANGCVASADCAVNAPGCSVTMTVSGTDLGCNGGASGTAVASQTGGTDPVSFDWSNGSSDASLAGLSAGTYGVTMTDGIGCITFGSVVLTEPSAISFVSTGTDPICKGESSGTITSVVSGGVLPYSFTWNNGVVADGDATDLSAGTYLISVQDANGCQETQTVALFEPAGPTLSTSSVDPTGAGTADGSATVSGTGGATPYTYAWDNGATTATATGLNEGSYLVVLTDANGCEFSATVQLFAGGVNGVQSLEATSVTLYPNPVTDKLNLAVTNGKIDYLLITNVIGKVVKEVRVTSDNYQIDTEGFAVGLYTIKYVGPNAHGNVKFMKIK